MKYQLGKVSGKTTTSLVDGIRQRALKVISDRLTKAANNVSNVAKNTVEEAIKKRPVYYALTGAFKGIMDWDLPAEFGLSDASAKIAADKIIQVLRDTVHTVVSKRNISGKNTKGELEVIIQYLNPEEYENTLKNDPEFHYSSHQHISNIKAYTKKYGAVKEYDIRWMQWLLDPKGEEANVEQLTSTVAGRYAILYDLNNVQAGHSRSGRAVMVSPWSAYYTGTPYTLPDICLPRNATSKNFIDDVGKDLRFRAYLKKKVEKALYIAMNGYPLPSNLKD